MNTKSPATSPGWSGILHECNAQVEGALEHLRSNVENIEEAQKVLLFLRTQIFLLVRELIARCSAQDWENLASRPWPAPHLLLLKLAGFDPSKSQEQGALASISAMYAEGPQGPKFAQALVLARLFLCCYRAPLFPLRDIRSAYLKNYIDFQMETSPLFYPGDGKIFMEHMENFLQSFVDFVEAPETPAADRLSALQALYTTNFGEKHTFAMVSGQNMRRLMELRYRVMRHISKEMAEADMNWVAPPRDPAKKIRLGIFSKAILCGGETWGMLASISALDRRKYEIILFAGDKAPGYYHDIAFYKKLVDSVDEIVLWPTSPIGKSIDQIRRYNIDILWHQSSYGLNGFDGIAFLFMHKLARIQCADMAMMAATTGNPDFQYFFNIMSSSLPKVREQEFTETELNSSATFIYIPDKWESEPNRLVTRESLNIPADAVVYFGGAALAKYNGEVLAAWLKVVKNAPNSYLVLYPFNPAWNPQNDTLISFHHRLQNQLAISGVSANRIKLVKNVNSMAISYMHGWGHIYLSSFPYGGCTSMTDALRGNLCPIFLSGKYSREMGDADVLASYGLEEFAAASEEEFVQKAVRLGTDSSYRTQTQSRVRDAWAKARPELWAKIAKSRADLIDQVVAKEFGAVP